MKLEFFSHFRFSMISCHHLKHPTSWFTDHISKPMISRGNFVSYKESFVVVRGQGPTICDVTYKHHLSWFPNMCINNVKAEQNSLWSPVAVDTIIFAKKSYQIQLQSTNFWKFYWRHASYFAHYANHYCLTWSSLLIIWSPQHFLRLWQTLNPKKSTWFCWPGC